MSGGLQNRCRLSILATIVTTGSDPCLECGCKGTDEECPLAACECDGQLSVNNDYTTAR